MLSSKIQSLKMKKSSKKSDNSDSSKTSHLKIVEKISATDGEYKIKYTGNKELDRKIFLSTCQTLLKNEFTEEVKSKINQAIDMVFEAFGDSKPREDGSAVYTHFFETAEILIRVFNITNVDAVISAILHDGPEDAPELISFDKIKAKFGANVKEIVEGVTKITSESELKDKGITEEEINHQLDYDDLEIASLLKIISFGIKQPLVYFVKFADRYHNILTLYGKKKPERRRALAEQTLRIYIPLMKKLDCANPARILSELCLMHIVADNKDDALSKLKTLKKIHNQEKIRLLNLIGNSLVDFGQTGITIENWFEKNFQNLYFLLSHNSLYDLYRAVARYNFVVPPDYSHFYILLVPKNPDKKEIFNTIAKLREELKIHFIFRDEKSELQTDENWYPSDYEKTLHTFWVSLPKTQENLMIQIQYQPDDSTKEKIDRTKFAVNAKAYVTKEELDAYTEIITDLINSKVKDKIQRAFYFFDKLYPQTYVSINLYNNQTSYLLPTGSVPLDLAFKVGIKYGRRFISANKIDPETRKSQNVPLNYKLQDNDIIELILGQNENTDSPALDFMLNSVNTLTAYNELRKLIMSAERESKSNVSTTIHKTIKLGGKDKFQLSQEITKLGHNNQINFTSINLGTLLQDPNFWNGELKLVAPNDTALNHFIIELLEYPEIDFIEVI